ncbi:hypothetical protein GGF31_000337 [Allomyces arbusculus]|nr:hypothetical protein GGF31_000337 [Allomyces arbusculus]
MSTISAHSTTHSTTVAPGAFDAMSRHAAAQLETQLDTMMRELFEAASSSPRTTSSSSNLSDAPARPAMPPPPPRSASNGATVPPAYRRRVPPPLTMPTAVSAAASLDGLSPVTANARKSHLSASDDSSSGRGSNTWSYHSGGANGTASYVQSPWSPMTPVPAVAAAAVNVTGGTTVTLADQGAACDDFLAAMLGDLHEVQVQYEAEAAKSSEDAPDAAAAGGSDDEQERRARMRAKAVHEIVATEQSYVANLSILVTQLVVPLRDLLASATSPGRARQLGMTNDDLQAIFGNIEQILELHRTLLSGLEERYLLWTPDQKISDIYLKVVPFFKFYTIYLANYQNAIDTLTRVRGQSGSGSGPSSGSMLTSATSVFDSSSSKTVHYSNTSDAARLIDSVELSPEFKGLTVPAYLIMPIQRIPRYILLLDNVIKYTNATHPDYDDLKRAVAEVKQVAEHNNEAIRHHEARQRVVLLQRRLSGRPTSYPPLVAPSREWIAQADFAMRVSARVAAADAALGVTASPRDELTRRTVILLSDLLLVVKRTAPPPEPSYMYKDEIPLWRLRAVDVDLEASSNGQFPLRVVGADRALIFYAQTRELRDEWGRKITDAARLVIDRRSTRSTLSARTPTSEVGGFLLSSSTSPAPSPTTPSFGHNNPSESRRSSRSATMYSSIYGSWGRRPSAPAVLPASQLQQQQPGVDQMYPPMSPASAGASGSPVLRGRRLDSSGEYAMSMDDFGLAWPPMPPVPQHVADDAHLYGASARGSASSSNSGGSGGSDGRRHGHGRRKSSAKSVLRSHGF